MAYDATWLSATTLGTGANFNLWTYVTTDNNAAVVASDYFSDGDAKGMKVGDFMLVQTTTTLPRTTPVDAGLYLVSAVTDGGAATIIAAVAAS